MTMAGPLLWRDPGVTVITAPYGLVGPIIFGTSASSVTIPSGIDLGSVFFDTNEFNLSFGLGQRLRATAVSAPTNWLEGICTSYVDDFLTIKVDLVHGSGTY